MKGLSLLELLIVLTVIGLLGAVAIPFGSEWYQAHAIKLMVQDIKQAIHQGKMAALIEHTAFRLAPIQSHQWSSGLALIQEDIEETRYVWQWSGIYQVTWHGFLSQNYMRFMPDFNRSALNGYFLIENQNRHVYFKVMINRLGRVRIVD